MPANLLLKLSAVASSLLLGAAFVSYRAGAFDWSSRFASTTVETPLVPAHPTVVAPPGAQVAPPTAPEQQIFAGSKSAAIFVEQQPTPDRAPEPAPPSAQQTATPAPPSAVIMSGSKSLMPAPANYQQGAVQARQTNRNTP